MSTEKLQIVADDREVVSGVPAFLSGIEGVSLAIRRLDWGDYRVDDRVVVERKTAADFAASLKDGRLFQQAHRARRIAGRPVYMVEGSASDWVGIGVAREAVQGALISLMLVFDLPVLRSYGPEETARLLVYTGRQLQRSRGIGYVPVAQGRAKHRATVQRRILQQLPGIGSDRANRLLEHFGGIRACLTADERRLQEVEGIGDTIARKMVELLEEPPAVYGRVAPQLDALVDMSSVFCRCRPWINS